MPPATPLRPWTRAVLKVGSALIAPNGRGCSTTHALAIAQFVVDSRRQGREVILVSSGAVAAGLATQPDATARTRRTIPEKQALAAIGQALLMAHWDRLFDAPCAQILLTHDDLAHRTRFLNARNTLSELLTLGAIPVVNENDTVAVDELKVGDNDNLAAHVAALAEADLLVICTDIDGLYNADPRANPDAQFVPVVDRVDERVLAMAGGANHPSATGGMQTKLEAAQKATTRGIDTVVINGTSSAALEALCEDRLHGTLFRRMDPPLSARSHWMLHAAPSTGRIVVDEGAASALRERGASLLPSGIVRVDGPFQRGDAVEVVVEGPGGVSVLAKGITLYASHDLDRIGGRQSREIADILGYAHAPHVIHRDDLVLTGPTG
ncbi:MAG: glutamate 5-kinase [Bacteroidota bacterium]